MANYLHGAYGSINIAASKVAVKGKSAIVYVGTAPVHLVSGGSANVNKPVLVSSIAEAKEKFGYSDDFASYTLCEAMKVHFDLNGIGPIVLINVMDPAKHKTSAEQTASLTPANGRITITNAENVLIDSLTIKAGSDVKTLGTDYTLVYDDTRKTISVREVTAGALGTSALTCTWTAVDPSAVDDADVIGTDDGAGMHTGLYAIKDVYQATGYIPSYLLCPGFASVPAVHKAMIENSRKVNGHWDVYVLCDLPITDAEGTAVTLANAAEWKAANGYNNDNETVYFPMVLGTDGKKYHISVLAAANLQTLLAEQEGIPYKTASNTAIAIAEGLYLGEANTGRFYDDELINAKLCKNGIASACYVGGKWVIWGAHSASYNQDTADYVNVAETARMMLFYISNNFQHRRSANIDKPMTANDLKAMISEEQARLDALVKIGALTHGTVSVDATMLNETDIANGDFRLAFSISTTPLAKSLTAVVTWTSEGFVSYYESFNA